MALRILYVEDNAVFAEQMARMFLAEHEVTVVPSLAKARQVTAGKEFDVVLCDYDLEDGKGDVFVREFRRGYPRTPVVAVSSHEEGNAALRRAGANVVCGKLAMDGIGQVLKRMGLVK